MNSSRSALQVHLEALAKRTSLPEIHESAETLSVGTLLRRTNSLPKDMHLIYRKSSTNVSSTLSPTPSLKADPSSLIRRVLSDLREADSISTGKASSTSPVHTSPGHFMRGLLSDLQQVELPRSPIPIFNQGTISEFDYKPQEDVTSSFGMPTSKQALDKGKCFSSISSAKHSTTTGATATMVTGFSGSSFCNDGEIIRLLPDSEEKTEDFDAAALAKLRRERNRSWNFSTINVLQVGKIPTVGIGTIGNAPEMTSSSLFSRTKREGRLRNANLNKMETTLVSAFVESFASLQQDNRRRDLFTPSEPQTERVLRANVAKLSESNSIAIHTALATSQNDFQDQDIDLESDSDSDGIWDDPKDFEYHKTTGRSLFSGKQSNSSNRRSFRRIESESENTLMRLPL